MIFIAVKWKVRTEHAGTWLDLVAEFTEATRAEPGNLFFDWSRSVTDPTEYVLLEAFADDEAGSAHVTSDHFKKAVDELANYVVAKPSIINVTIPDATGWSEMGEITPRQQ
jgi:quinol monooxygenase YgiN